MLSAFVIIALCLLLLIAYLFDVSAKYTRIPAVVLLLALGWSVRQLTVFAGLDIPDLSFILPALGSVGLILIVLEGSLELEVNHSKLTVLRRSFLMALLPMLLITAMIAYMFYSVSDYSLNDCILNAIPLAVISSAIAIPSAANLLKQNREFIIYESSFSDILGVLFFNFMLANEVVGAAAFGGFVLQLLIICVLSLAATVALAWLLKRIKHHIKFGPIIILIVLIYEVSKVFHLPGLLFILIFGLFIGNLDELKRFAFIRKLNPDKLNAEVHKFKDIAVETAFIVRASFFILFGFLISTAEILNQSTMMLAGIVFMALVFFRYLFLLMFKLPVFPLLFIAPRGLITILLFLSLPAKRYIPYINNSLVIQVIILTALFMMAGLMVKKRVKQVG